MKSDRLNVFFCFLLEWRKRGRWSRNEMNWMDVMKKCGDGVWIKFIEKKKEEKEKSVILREEKDVFSLLLVLFFVILARFVCFPRTLLCCSHVFLSFVRQCVCPCVDVVKWQSSLITMKSSAYLKSTFLFFRVQERLFES